MKQISNLVSYLFHPLLIPVYFVLIMWVNSVYPLQFYPNYFKGFLLALVGIHSLILPAIIILFLYYRKIITDIHLVNAESRTIPFLYVMIIYLITAVIFYFNKNIPDIFSLVFAISGLNISILLLALRWIKLSAHAMGISGLFTLLLYYQLFHSVNYFLEIVIVILIIGIVSTARLYLKAHKAIEVYLGIIISIGINFITLFLISNLFNI